MLSKYYILNQLVCGLRAKGQFNRLPYAVKSALLIGSRARGNIFRLIIVKLYKMIVRKCRDISDFTFFANFVMNFCDRARLIRIINYYINHFPSTFHVSLDIWNLTTVTLLSGRLN